MRNHRQRIIVAALACLAGCSAPPLHEQPRSAYLGLQSGDPRARIDSIHEVGQGKDPKSIPLLIDRLEDDDPDVRFYAILALERITGQTFGYRYYEPPAKRRQAVERWRAWLVGGGPTTLPAEGGGS